tara:strand:- start:1053 stop:1598 length:546 start_codon:yes stop_codon:yes gene_type:complete
MDAKLIKVDDIYRLCRKDNLIIGTTDKEYQKAFSDHCALLSLKNCQAIERGYDLDELVEDNFKGLRDCINDSDIAEFYISLVKTVVTELLGDKKFSEREVRRGMLFMLDKCLKLGADDVNYVKIKDDYVKSLQQTEWDVEVEMEVVSDFDSRAEFDGQVFSTNKKLVPKLDADGCLILRKI